MRVLIAESLAIWKRHLDAPVLSQGKFLGQQGVDGVDGGHLATFEAAHGDVEDFEGARHFQADEIALTRSPMTAGALIGHSAGRRALRPTAS